MTGKSFKFFQETYPSVITQDLEISENSGVIAIIFKDDSRFIYTETGTEKKEFTKYSIEFKKNQIGLKSSVWNTSKPNQEELDKIPIMIKQAKKNAYVFSKHIDEVNLFNSLMSKSCISIYIQDAKEDPRMVGFVQVGEQDISIRDALKAINVSISKFPSNNFCNML